MKAPAGYPGSTGREGKAGVWDCFCGGRELCGAGGLPAFILLPSPRREGHGVRAGPGLSAWMELPCHPTPRPRLPGEDSRGSGTQAAVATVLCEGVGYRRVCLCTPPRRHHPARLRGQSFRVRCRCAPRSGRRCRRVAAPSLGLLWPQPVQPGQGLSPSRPPRGASTCAPLDFTSPGENPQAVDNLTLPVVHGSKTKLSRKNDKTPHSKARGRS